MVALLSRSHLVDLGNLTYHAIDSLPLSALVVLLVACSAILFHLSDTSSSAQSSFKTLRRRLLCSHPAPLLPSYTYLTTAAGPSHRKRPPSPLSLSFTRAQPPHSPRSPRTPRTPREMLQFNQCAVLDALLAARSRAFPSSPKGGLPFHRTSPPGESVPALPTYSNNATGPRTESLARVAPRYTATIDSPLAVLGAPRWAGRRGSAGKRGLIGFGRLSSVVEVDESPMSSGSSSAYSSASSASSSDEEEDRGEWGQDVLGRRRSTAKMQCFKRQAISAVESGGMNVQLASVGAPPHYVA